MPGFRIDNFYRLPPERLGAMFIVTEIEVGQMAGRTFNAAAPVLDWETVKAQMLYLNGAIRMKNAG